MDVRRWVERGEQEYPYRRPLGMSQEQFERARRRRRARRRLTRLIRNIVREVLVEELPAALDFLLEVGRDAEA